MREHERGRERKREAERALVLQLARCNGEQGSQQCDYREAAERRSAAAKSRSESVLCAERARVSDAPLPGFHGPFTHSPSVSSAFGGREKEGNGSGGGCKLKRRRKKSCVVQRTRQVAGKPVFRVFSCVGCCAF